jgi:hypothetical protein
MNERGREKVGVGAGGEKMQYPAMTVLWAVIKRECIEWR